MDSNLDEESGSPSRNFLTPKKYFQNRQEKPRTQHDESSDEEATEVVMAASCKSPSDTQNTGCTDDTCNVSDAEESEMPIVDESEDRFQHGR